MNEKEWLDSQLGIDIWSKKYRYNNETFDEWLDRISNGNKKIRQLIIDKKFLFGGRILANRGLQDKGRKVTFSNCYVIESPEDNIESIFGCSGKLARTYSYGGGCGIDLSKLRPKNAKVNNAAKATSGAVSFMELYSMVTGLIAQNGRRGALMLSMDCSHPDIEEFINIKNDMDKVTKANISIRVTDKFMQAVLDGKDWELFYNVEATGERISKIVKASDLFRLIAKANWSSAEPGFLMWDRVEKWNLLSEDPEFKYAGVNPCGEEPLPAGGSCLLGSINLSEYIVMPFTKNAFFNYDAFERDIPNIVKGMNEVLHEGLSLHPLQEQRDSVNEWRQIGIGIMGMHDALLKLSIRYGSQESLQVCGLIAKKLIDKVLLASANLTDKYGAYPNYHKEAVLKSPFLNEMASPETLKVIKEKGLANSQLLTIAPTGSLSTMLGISGGVEPIFNVSYTRKTESLHGKDEYYKVYTPIIKTIMDNLNIEKEEDLPDFVTTAMTLNYSERIDMQSVWQRHIDAAISSTVNVPEDFTVEQVEFLYLKAWQKGLKGVTIYRDNCSRAGILTNEKPKEKEKNNDEMTTETLPRGFIIDPDNNVVGKKRKITTGCGNLHINAFFDPDNGDLLEVFLTKGSTGGCNNFMIGLSRMISLCARAGVNIYSIVDQLNSSGVCASYAVRTATKKDTSKGSCCPVAIGNALLSMYKEMLAEIDEDEYDVEYKVEEEVIDEISKPVINDTKPKCPECGASMIIEGGCGVCKDCGYSKCS